MRHRVGITQAERGLLAEMGVDKTVWSKINAASNHTDGQLAIDEAKAICRKGYKAAAGKYHPDVNQHLPEKERNEKEKHFKLLKAAFEYFTTQYRHQWPRSNTRRAAHNFDPFGFQGSYDQKLEDELRFWNDPNALNFMRIKREQERQQRADINYLEQIRKRELWRSMGLNYDEMMRRDRAKPPERITTLAGGSGVWYQDRSVWTKTARPKK